MNYYHLDDDDQDEYFPKFYPEENPYKVGDAIEWNGLKLVVGDDFGEIHKWYPGGGNKKHIVTTCGRVLDIESIKRI